MPGNQDQGVPFKALLSASGLLVAILSVAGYSYRWNYLYNFGIHTLVFSIPLESLPVYAIEIARNPSYWIHYARLLILFVIPTRIFLSLISRYSEGGSGNAFQKPLRALTAALPIGSQFSQDVIVAIVSILVAFQVGAESGYQNYRLSIAEQTSTLPEVTIVSNATNKNSLPFTCQPLKELAPLAINQQHSQIIGNINLVEKLQSGMACTTLMNYRAINGNGWSWRLLHRDEKYVYIFSTVQDPDNRPLTLVLPANNDSTLILNTL